MMKRILLAVIVLCLCGCKPIHMSEPPIETLFCEGESMIGGKTWNVVFIWERRGEFVRYNFEGYDKKWNKWEDFTCQEFPDATPQAKGE